MKFYIASGLDGAVRAKEIAACLVAAGHEHTYDWTVHGPVGSQGYARLREVAQAESVGVARADVVVAVLPGGRGTHVEIGMGIALGKVVLLFGAPEDFEESEKTCAFYHHGQCRWFVTEAAHEIARIVCEVIG